MRILQIRFSFSSHQIEYMHWYRWIIIGNRARFPLAIGSWARVNRTPPPHTIHTRYCGFDKYAKWLGRQSREALDGRVFASEPIYNTLAICIYTWSLCANETCTQALARISGNSRREIRNSRRCVIKCVEWNRIGFEKLHIDASDLLRFFFVSTSQRRCDIGNWWRPRHHWWKVICFFLCCRLTLVKTTPTFFFL